MDAFDVRLHGRRLAADDSPAHAPAGRQVSFREPIESNYRHVGRKRRDGHVLLIGKQQPVVYLVRKNHQVMFAGEFHDAFEGAARDHRAGGIVRIDHHDPARAGEDVAGQPLEIGLPTVVFVEVIAVWLSAEFGEHGGIKRVLG